MDLLLQPGKLRGCVTPPPSKSQAHRLIIAAMLAEGVSTLWGVSFSEDVKATLSCAGALGAAWEETKPGTVRIRGLGGRSPVSRPHLDCGESGSTLRFFIPISLALAGGGFLTGRGRLMQRPQQPYFDLFDAKGIRYEASGDLLELSGRLSAGRYELPGNVSSQFFTGLLFALPLCEGESLLRSTTALESAGYVELTLDVLRRAGVSIERDGDVFGIRPQRYRPLEAQIEADWSQAAFWLAARALGSPLQIDGLNPDSRQGDRVMADYVRLLAGDGDVRISVAQCPDLVPPLAALAAVRRGCCRIEGAERLRIKESDRLATVAAALRRMGAQIREEKDGLLIDGLPSLRGGGEVDCANDHRIAMMSAVAATCCERSVLLRGADCVKKSYPDFWDVYQTLGGTCHVVELG